jgi:gluconate kinase
MSEKKRWTFLWFDEPARVTLPRKSMRKNNMDEPILTQSQINALENVLAEINRGVGTWQERRDALREALSEEALSNLEEVAGWFAE